MKTEKSGTSSRFALWIFIACCLISLVGFGLIVNTIGLFFAPIARTFRASRGSVALMTTLQNLAAAISLIFAGKIMSRVRLRRLLLVCFAVIGVLLCLLSWARQLWQFYLAWTIIGIFQPFAITLAIPVLLSRWFHKRLGTFMGIALGLSAFGGTIFNPVVSAAISSWGWRSGFLLEGLLILLILLPVALFLRDQPDSRHQAYGGRMQHKEGEKREDLSGLSLSQAARKPVFYGLALAMIALQYVSGSVQHVSGHIVNTGLSLDAGAAVVSGVMLGAACGKIAIGWFFDHLHQRSVILLFAFLGAAGWSGQIFLRQAAWLIGSGFVLGLGQGLCLVGLPYLIRNQFGQRDYSNILSVISMLGAFAMSVAVGLDGYLFDQTGSYDLGWTINVAAYILSAILLVLLLKSPVKKFVVRR